MKLMEVREVECILILYTHITSNIHILKPKTFLYLLQYHYLLNRDHICIILCDINNVINP